MIFLKKDSRAIEAMRALGWNQKSMESSYDTIASFVKKFGHKENLTVYFVDAIPRYSVVIIDNIHYLIASTNASGLACVPALQLRSGGFLCDFLSDDVDRICENNNAN